MAYKMLVFLLFIFNDYVRPKILTFTGPILPNLQGWYNYGCRWTIWFFDSSRDVAVATDFVGKINLQSTQFTCIHVPTTRSRRTARSATKLL